MNTGFYSIRLNKTELGNYRSTNVPVDEIFPLGRLNIFVGTNNSGKSRLLRGIIRTKAYEYTTQQLDYRKLQALAKEIKPNLLAILEGSPFGDMTPKGGTSLRQSLEDVESNNLMGSKVALGVALQQAFSNIKP